MSRPSSRSGGGSGGVGGLALPASSSARGRTLSNGSASAAAAASGATTPGSPSLPQRSLDLTLGRDLSSLVASALSSRSVTKRPSRLAPHTVRHKAASLSISLTLERDEEANQDERSKQTRREDALRDQIRALAAFSSSEGESQYQLMDRSHSNPMWVVPPAAELDELSDEHGDAFLARAMEKQRARFNSRLAPQLAVRLTALQGAFNTREPEGAFLSAIEGGLGLGGPVPAPHHEQYDPLHGNPVSPRPAWAASAPTSRTGSRRGSRSTSQASQRRVSLSSSSQKPPHPPHPHHPPVDGSSTPLAGTVAPESGPLTDRALLAQVFAECSSGPSSAGASPSSSPSFTASRPSRLPPPLLHLVDEATEMNLGTISTPHAAYYAPPFATQTPVAASIPSAVIPSAVPSAPSTPAVLPQATPRSALKTSSSGSPRRPSISRAASLAASTGARPRQASVSWVHPRPHEAEDDETQQPHAHPEPEEKVQHPPPPIIRAHSHSHSAHRPHTADPLHSPKQHKPSPPTPGGESVSTSTFTSRPPSSMAGSVSARSARSSRASGSGRRSSASGYIVPNQLTSFGYTDRQLACTGLNPNESDAFGSGSSCQPLDIISRPRSSRNDSGGSSGLAHRGCSVKYRTTPSDHGDPLSARLADALAGGAHTVLDLKVFRREVELLTNQAGVSNTAIRALLNEKSTAERIQLLRRQAAQKKGLSAGGVGGADPLDAASAHGLTQRRYSARSQIPARYTKLAGTDVQRIRAPEFGEPPVNPFRDVVAPQGAGGAFQPQPTTHGGKSLVQAAEGAYVGPGTYHTEGGEAMTRPAPAASPLYGPPHSAGAGERFKLGDPTGPADCFELRPSPRGALGSSTPRGHVALAKSVPRKDYEFMGLRSVMASSEAPPPPALYDPSNKWLAEAGVGVGGSMGGAFARAPRFEPPREVARHPATRNISRMLAIASPRDGPGALHAVLPPRSRAAVGPYDPSVQSFWRAHGPLPHEMVRLEAQAEEEALALGIVGGRERLLLERDTPRASRALEAQSREMDALLSGALATTPAIKDPFATRSKFVPVLLRQPTLQQQRESEENEEEAVLTPQPPVEAAPETATDPVMTAEASAPVSPEVEDPNAIPPMAEASVPSLHEQRARVALFGSTGRAAVVVASPEGHEEENAPIDHARRNRLALALASPRARKMAQRERSQASKVRRALVASAAARLEEERLGRIHEKIAAAEEAQAARHGQGMFLQRWFALSALASRTSHMARVLAFSRRMRSEAHKRHAAARAIQIHWRRFHDHRTLIRRRAAILTLNRVFGTFRVRLRIRRKQKAARLLRAFFANIEAMQFQPQMGASSGAPPRSSPQSPTASTSTLMPVDHAALAADAHRVANLRRKAREQAATLAKLKLRSGGQRTLVGLIRHFKTQVVVIQRAWRAYCLMREYQIDMHVLLYDEILSSHFQALYSKMHSGSATGGNAVALTSGGKPSHSKQRRSMQLHARLVKADADHDLMEQRDAEQQQKVKGAHAPPVPSPADARKAKLTKPVELKMDARFTMAEKRAILLQALRQRKMRFLRVKKHYLQQQAKFVSDQSHGLSAARRLLEESDSRFSAALFNRRYERAHPPPYLPRLMTHRQMMQLMNAASLARKETRKTRYNLAAATREANAPERGGEGHAGRSVKHLFHRSIRPSAPLASSSGAHEFDHAESRMRESMLRVWAAQLPIPTRAVISTPEELAEDAAGRLAKLERERVQKVPPKVVEPPPEPAPSATSPTGAAHARGASSHSPALTPRHGHARTQSRAGGGHGRGHSRLPSNFNPSSLGLPPHVRSTSRGHARTPSMAQPFVAPSIATSSAGSAPSSPQMTSSRSPTTLFQRAALDDLAELMIEEA